MDFAFLPLELWRASSLAQETKSVIAAYERCLASGDMDGLGDLRAAIEDRIDALEAFYTRHLDDERSLLFEKQRLKLRKLLHEYDAAVASLSARTNPLPPPPPPPQTLRSLQPQQPGSGAAAAAAAVLAGGQYSSGAATATATTRVIREDSRLTLAETCAWFAQAGAAEMRDVSLAIVERVYGHVTRTNTDGRMSVRDLRQWYISFGKRALADGLEASDLDKELVPTKYLSHSRSVRPGKGGGGGGSSASLHRPPSTPSGGGVQYPWEAGAEGGASSGSAATASSLSATVQGGLASGSSSSNVPLVLPNHMIEFQLRLTKAEFEAMSLRRRQLEAEERYKNRVAKARADRGGGGEGGVGGKGGGEHTSGVRDEPFTEPLHAVSSLHLRGAHK